LSSRVVRKYQNSGCLNCEQLHYLCARVIFWEPGWGLLQSTCSSCKYHLRTKNNKIQICRLFSAKAIQKPIESLTHQFWRARKKWHFFIILSKVLISFNSYIFDKSVYLYSDHPKTGLVQISHGQFVFLVGFVSKETVILSKWL
jgi:hypothetical protein